MVLSQTINRFLTLFSLFSVLVSADNTTMVTKKIELQHKNPTCGALIRNSQLILGYPLGKLSLLDLSTTNLTAIPSKLTNSIRQIIPFGKEGSFLAKDFKNVILQDS